MNVFALMFRRKRLQPLLALLDLLWMATAICLSEWLCAITVSRRFDAAALPSFVLPALVCFALWTLIAGRLSINHLQDIAQTAATFSRVTIGVLLLMPIAMGLAFLVRSMYSRLLLFYLGGLLVLGFTEIRVLLWRAILRFRSQFAVRTAIVGTGRVASEIAAKITSCPELMRDLVAFVHPANCEAPNFVPGMRGQATSSLSSVNVLDLLKQNHVAEVILAGIEPGTEHVNPLVWQCRRSGIEVCIIPPSYSLYSSHARILDLGGVPFVKVESRVPHDWELRCKRLFDLVLLFPLLLAALPALLFVAAILALRGRAMLDSEIRCGRNGEEFRMYRFHIPRHSRELGGIDAIFDRLSVPELPQLWNVATGDMSLVGPRPEAPERVRNYSEWQRQRLAMPAGLTGLAQVQGLRDNHSSDEKSRYDLQYIHNWSPLLDLSLMVQTAWTLCFRARIEQTGNRHGQRLHSVTNLPNPGAAAAASISLGEADVNRAQSGAD